MTTNRKSLICEQRAIVHFLTWRERQHVWFASTAYCYIKFHKVSIDSSQPLGRHDFGQKKPKPLVLIKWIKGHNSAICADTDKVFGMHQLLIIIYHPPSFNLIQPTLIEILAPDGKDWRTARQREGPCQNNIPSFIGEKTALYILDLITYVINLSVPSRLLKTSSLKLLVIPLLLMITNTMGSLYLKK